MAITDKKTGVWGLDQVYNKVNQGSIWPVPGSVGDNHTLWTWGANDDGQLGQNNLTQYSSPVQIPGTTWMDVGIKNDGTLWSWGRNTYGQLGINSVNPGYSSPIQVGSDTTWKANYTLNYVYSPVMAVKNDGTLWGWGNNQYGQLGQNNITQYSSPVQVGTDTTWPKIKSEEKFGWSAYNATTLVIKTDGTLWAWGYNVSGQIGNNTTGTNYSSPVQIGSGTDWDKVGTNSYSNRIATAIKTDGTLWVWGSNAYGQLGVNASNNVNYSSPIQIPGTTWKSVTGTTSNILATKTDGTLWTAGRGADGQLSQNNTTDYSSPVQIPGTTWDVPIKCSYRSGGAIKTDGTLWKWGLNQSGELGQNNNVKYSSPVQIPGNWSKVYNGAFNSTWILKTI